MEVGKVRLGQSVCKKRDSTQLVTPPDFVHAHIQTIFTGTWITDISAFLIICEQIWFSFTSEKVNKKTSSIKLKTRWVFLKVIIYRIGCDKLFIQ